MLDDLVEEDLLSVGIPAERLRRVDNGIDLQSYFPASVGDRSILRQKHQLPVDAGVILFCGQLTERKGIGELLAAWDAGFARQQNAVLVICGDGPLRGAVELACDGSDSRIVYYGPVADSSEYFRMADALILPSRCESFGNVIIEALASGVPVASTACGIAPRVLADGRCGWLIADTDPGAIELTLQKIFADAARWAVMAAEGRRVAQGFSFEYVAENYVALYSELLARSGTGH